MTSSAERSGVDNRLMRAASALTRRGRGAVDPARAAVPRTAPGRRTGPRPLRGPRSPARRRTPVLLVRSGRRARRSIGVRPRSPVLGRREDGGRRDGRAEVGEQRSQRVVQGERVARGAGGRADEHRLAGQAVALEDVEERLEQSAVGRGEDRRHGDQPVGRDHRVSVASRRRALGKPGEQVVREVLGVVAELDPLGGRRCRRLAERVRRAPPPAGRPAAGSRTGWPSPADTTTSERRVISQATSIARPPAASARRSRPPTASARRGCRPERAAASRAATS